MPGVRPVPFLPDLRHNLEARNFYEGDAPRPITREAIHRRVEKHNGQGGEAAMRAIRVDSGIYTAKLVASCSLPRLLRALSAQPSRKNRPAGAGGCTRSNMTASECSCARDAVPLQSVIRRKTGELRHEIHSSPSCVAVGSDIERRGNANLQTPVGAGVA